MNSLVIRKINKTNGYGLYYQECSKIYINNKFVCDYFGDDSELDDVIQKVLDVLNVDCEIRIEEEYL